MMADTSAASRPSGSVAASCSHRFRAGARAGTGASGTSHASSAHRLSSLSANKSEKNDSAAGSRQASSAQQVRAGATVSSMAFTERRPRHSSICTVKAASTTASFPSSASMAAQWNMMPATEARPLVSVQAKWSLVWPTARQFTSVTPWARYTGWGFSWPKGARQSTSPTVSSVSSSRLTAASTSVSGWKADSGSFCMYSSRRRANS